MRENRKSGSTWGRAGGRNSHLFLSTLLANSFPLGIEKSYVGFSGVNQPSKNLNFINVKIKLVIKI
jgi:hypothetical protein